MLSKKITRNKEIKEEKEFIEKIGYCQGCGARNESLVIHHLEKKLSHPEQRFDKKNWRVLCWKCHLITEQGGSIRGRKFTAKEFNDKLKKTSLLYTEWRE